MNWIKTARDVYTGFVAGIHHGKFREMLELDRDTACKGIADVVEQMTPAELDAFEREFLAHGANVVGKRPGAVLNEQAIAFQERRQCRRA